MQGIGEVDWLLIFVPSPVRIVQRFVDIGNSSMSHLTTKMQKEVREDFHWILLHPIVGRGSISVVRKLISTYHCFFLVLDRNQNQNFFFVLSKKWSLMKIFWFNNSMVLAFLFSTTQQNMWIFLHLFLICIMVSQTELIRWCIWVPYCHGFSLWN